MSRLSQHELGEMRRLATMGYAPFVGSVTSDREADPMIPLRRSQIAEFRHALLRAIDEIERCYEQLPTD